VVCALKRTGRLGAVESHRDEASERRHAQVREHLLAVEVRRIDLEVGQVLGFFTAQRIASSEAAGPAARAQKG
jgi:hypothetical protein